MCLSARPLLGTLAISLRVRAELLLPKQVHLGWFTLLSLADGVMI